MLLPPLARAYNCIKHTVLYNIFIYHIIQRCGSARGDAPSCDDGHMPEEPSTHLRRENRWFLTVRDREIRVSHTYTVTQMLQITCICSYQSGSKHWFICICLCTWLGQFTTLQLVIRQILQEHCIHLPTIHTWNKRRMKRYGTNSNPKPGTSMQ